MSGSIGVGMQSGGGLGVGRAVAGGGGGGGGDIGGHAWGQMHPHPHSSAPRVHPFELQQSAKLPYELQHRLVENRVWKCGCGWVGGCGCVGVSISTFVSIDI